MIKHITLTLVWVFVGIAALVVTQRPLAVDTGISQTQTPGRLGLPGVRSVAP